MKTLAFFNNKGGVGKTSLVYHLTWMYAELGIKVIAADLDPQANLSAMFLEDDRLLEIWPDGDHQQSIIGSITPLIKGTGDIKNPYIENITDQIGLLVGDLGLAQIEDDLSQEWPNCLDGKERSFRVISAFYRILEKAASRTGADLILIDVGPNLGAINRGAVISADYVVVPMAPDLFSLQGLRNLGPSLRRWRKEWQERLLKKPTHNIILPKGEMNPVGYIIMQHVIRMDRPAKAYGQWIERIPDEYRQSVLGQTEEQHITVADDSNCLAQLKHYRSLMPMAMETRKPIFLLKPADGAIGAHMSAVRDCYIDFKNLATKIAHRCQIELPNLEPQPSLFD